MEYLKVCVENFGKIKQAEVEVAPFVLFVGDNNSGKSYLTSLIWGLQNYDIRNCLFSKENMEKSQYYNDIKACLKNNMLNCEKENVHFELKEYGALIQNLINDCLQYEKNDFIRWLFNTDEVGIDKLTIEIPHVESVIVDFEIIHDRRILEKMDFDIEVKMTISKNKISRKISWLVNSLEEVFSEHGINFIISLLCSHIFRITYNRPMSVYLPASRTGFMLTKDVINQVGRDNTFNSSVENNIIPFTRPINSFLNVINSLSLDNSNVSNKYNDIIQYIENDMANGVLSISDMPNKEVRYIPDGSSKKSYPLRVVSGVVTELSPLLLLLKYNKHMTNIFYEEPEIGLHPQLQCSMARVLCRLVNSNINVCVTTHSDLIIQHINNMISLNDSPKQSELLKKYNYVKKDLIDYEKVRLYQFNTKRSGRVSRTILEEIECTENGFEIPTFNEALDRITEEAYNIQEK